MTLPALARLPFELAEFARAFAETGNGKAAAEKAGIHPNQAGTWAKHALARPDVKAAYQAVIRSRFAEAGPIALNLLIDIVKNESKKYDDRLRLQAARELLERSGYTAEGMAEQQNATKPLEDMGRDELKRMLQDTEAELAKRAKNVQNAPQPAAPTHQVIDMEG